MLVADILHEASCAGPTGTSTVSAPGALTLDASYLLHLYARSEMIKFLRKHATHGVVFIGIPYASLLWHTHAYTH